MIYWNCAWKIGSEMFFSPSWYLHTERMYTWPDGQDLLFVFSDLEKNRNNWQFTSSWILIFFVLKYPEKNDTNQQHCM